ncbi:hypothetical protein TREMEDRAFT_74572 [Tremella mesenterica DSM 1558]|uniref:uncharacterized protein n=1 Tax=Tremella mesenterica (strain ATCC 24925 / CBS 8224 / DSM 1558 / NBRC 9311 / NRRL Y-6157 / RJB 2259-6 / UBC 559-6) TaxID=578456 RepID=UPI0003F490E6|nr:uncharacterized protein TREMEDRAFT_74572 [Tremella mesenterica DSM 1558]EIW67403.1 hypothetical protein TREMEDRAFT_74572 [Tremella mesenterica DSM 1558]
MSPPNSVPDQFRPGFLPPSVAKQMQDNSPGQQRPLTPAPLDDVLADGTKYKPAGKLQGKKAVVTGGDSGIGRAVCILYALEGADIFLHCHPAEETDAQDTKEYISKVAPNAKVELCAQDLREEKACLEMVEKIRKWSSGSVHILVNNHATQQEVPAIADLSSEQWRHVFDLNIHSFFYLTKNILPMMPWGGSIINNASINPFVGHPGLLDYTATKGAIVGFTRALSNQIVKEKGVRVNAVCPGPIWTPLVSATMTKESLESFGLTTAIGRAGQPVEVATAFVFLASADSSYFTAQCFHVNGGQPY